MQPLKMHRHYVRLLQDVHSRRLDPFQSSHVLKFCSRCESMHPAERDEWLGGLQATYRFTFLMSGRLCWEQDMIDSVRQNWKRRIAVEVFDKDDGVEGIWHQSCLSYMPGTTVRLPLVVAPLVWCESSICWMFPFCTSTHRNARLPKKNKGRIPGKGLQMLLAVSRGEVHPSLLPAHK